MRFLLREEKIPVYRGVIKGLQPNVEEPSGGLFPRMKLLRTGKTVQMTREPC